MSDIINVAIKIGTLEESQRVFSDRLKKLETENKELVKSLEEKTKILADPKNTISIKEFEVLCGRVDRIEDLLWRLFEDMREKGTLPSGINYKSDLDDSIEM